MRKRILSVLIAIIMAVSLLQSFFGVVSVAAPAGGTTDGKWSSAQQSKNLIPTLVHPEYSNDSGKDVEKWQNWWDTVMKPAGWGSAGISNGNNKLQVYTNEDGDVGLRHTTRGDGDANVGSAEYTGGVFYTVNLSEADKVKANLGQLSASASCRFYCQGTATWHASVRAEFFNSGGSRISEEKETSSDYDGGGDQYRSLSLPQKVVPANTSYIKFWYSDQGNFNHRKGVCNLKAYLHDGTAPAATGNGALELTSVVDSNNKVAIAGNTIKYSISFNEKVSIVSKGTAYITIGGEAYTSSASAAVVTKNGVSAVVYTFVLPEANKNGIVALSSISGLTVKDEAGNQTSYNGIPSVGTFQFYKNSKVSNTVSKLTFLGGTTAIYGTNYTATLSASTGYKLPDTIKITTDGSTLIAGSNTYSYNSATGTITVYGKAIKGDIEITAFGTPITYTIKYNSNKPVGCDSTMAGNMVDSIHTYDTTAELSANGYTLTGWTFKGWAETANATVTKYIDKQSVKNLTVTDGGEIELYAVWQENKYHIKYNSNKPANASSPIIGTTGNTVLLHSQNGNIAKNGYSLKGWIFMGWSTTPGGGVDYNEFDTVSKLKENNEDIFNLYAVWTPIKNQIELNANGGSGASAVTASYDHDMPDMTMPSKAGYVFDGFYTQPVGGTKYYNANGTSAKLWDKTEDTTLYAHWTPIKYNIHFYSQGRFVKEQKNIVFGTINLPSAESLSLYRKNFNFMGWNLYDEQNWGMYQADTPYNIGLTTTEGSTVYVYAAWQEKNKHTLSYDANGGIGSPSSEIIHEEDTTTLSCNTPTRENYKFMGWALTSDAETAEYTAEDSFTMGTEPVTLYAVWKKNPKLTYDPNGGVFGVYVTDVYPEAGSNVAVASAVPQKSNSSFLGWSTDKNASLPAYTSGQSIVMPENDVVLFAIYGLAQHSIDFNVAGGYSVNGLNSTYTYGDTASFTVSGDNASVYANGKLLTPNAGIYSFTVKEDTIVTVSDNSLLSVMYNANGGSNATVDSTVYVNGDSVTVSNGNTERTGYTLAGWATSADAALADYTAGDTFEILGTTVLYAVWEANSYSIAFNSNGGSGAISPVQATYDEALTLSANTFEKPGHRFAGWTTNLSYGVMYTDEGSVRNLTHTNNEMVTLYAVWEPALTTIHLNQTGGSGGNTTCFVKYGEWLSSENISAPTRYGYIFGGYYTEKDADGTEIFDKDMKVVGKYAISEWDKTNSSITLYAYWVPVEYIICFVNGTQQLEAMQKAKYNQPFELYTASALGIVSPEGYHVSGWATASGSNVIAYTDGQTVTTGLSGTNNSIVYLYAVIGENDSYTLKYDANGGSAAPESATKRLANGQTYIDMTISSSAPAKDGYRFSGWNTMADGTGTAYASNSQIQISKDTTLYAVWTKIQEYPVSYFANTTDIVYNIPALQIKVEDVDLTLSKTTPLRTGYKFLGWATSEAGATTYAADGNHIYSENSALNLYAKWERESFTVTLPTSEAGYIVSDAGQSKTVMYGEGLNFDITINEGYTAKGMVVSANGIVYGFDCIVGNTYKYTLKNITSNTTVSIADVEKIEFPVTLTNGTGYTVSSLIQSVKYGDSFTFQVTLADGYETAAAVAYLNGTPITGTRAGNVYTYTLADVKVQPVISIVVETRPIYTIVFANGESIYEIKNVEDGQKLPAPLTPVREGYVFDGWCIDKNTSEPYNFDNIVSNAFVLYAKWIPKTYDVTWTDISGYTIASSDSRTVEYGGSFTFTVNVDDGFENNFKVYANSELVNATAEDEYIVSNITDRVVLTLVSGDKTVYAITFYGGGNLNEYITVPVSQIKVYDEASAIASEYPTRTGYTFIGWLGSDGNTYQPGDMYDNNADLDLTAQWEKNLCNVTFMDAEVQVGEAVEVYYNDKIGILPVPEKDGYVFAGWYDNPNCEGVRITEDEIIIGDTTYYARWILDAAETVGYSGVFDGEIHYISTQFLNISRINSATWYKVTGDGDVEVGNGVIDNESLQAKFPVAYVKDTGTYYCKAIVMAMDTSHTEHEAEEISKNAEVVITARPLVITADSSEKVYDSTALIKDTFTADPMDTEGNKGLKPSHTVALSMTSGSTITSAGTIANIIDTVTIKITDSNNKDITDNYTVSTVNGSLTVTQAPLTVAGKDIYVYTNSSMPAVDSFYTLGGIFGEDEVILNASITKITDNGGNEVDAATALGSAGTYTVCISYDSISTNYTLAGGQLESKLYVSNPSLGGGGGGGGGAASGNYTVKFDTDGGNQIPNAVINKNGTVSKPVEPTKEGFIFGGWYTDKGLTEEYDFSDTEAKNITLYAKWISEEESAGTVQPSVWENPFEDIKTDDWYYEAVKFANQCGFMNGTSKTKFEPDLQLTRGMFVAVLYRLEDEPAAHGINFIDVENGMYYKDAIGWASANGIVKGISDTVFAPDSNITREQIAAMLYRYVQYKDYNISMGENIDILSYDDYDKISEYAVRAMQWVCDSGLIKGRTESTLNPQDAATRTEMAMILMRFIEAYK